MPRHIRSWRRLDEALADVMKAGLAKSDAKQDICDAIADRVIDFRAMVELEVEDDDGGPPGYRNDKSQSRIEGCWLTSRQVKIPARLRPPDFNWKHSSTKDEWYSTFNSSIDDPHPRIGTEPEYRKIKVVELCAADVTKMLVPSGGTDSLAQKNLRPNRSKSEIKRFVQEHYTKEKNEGRRPSKNSAIEAAQKAGIKGHRKDISDTCGELFPETNQRGRPLGSKNRRQFQGP